MKLQNTIYNKFSILILLTTFFSASAVVRPQTPTSTPTPTPTQPPFTERLLTGGGSAWSGLVPAPNGRLYGLTYDGGTSNQGTLYSVDTVLSSVVVHVNFNGANGATPYDEMTFDAASGKFYGATDRGGMDNNGTVFSYVPGANTVTTLRNDLLGHYDAIGPLVVSGGFIYGGLGYNLSGVGAIFRMATNGSGFEIIHTFAQFSQRSYGLTLADGWLYGVTYYGGIVCNPNAPNGCGTVFRLRPVLPGNNDTQFQTLYASQNFGEGAPQRPVVYGSDGLIYFNNHYRIHRFDPNNPAATLQPVWTEPGGTISMTMIEGSDGRLYVSSYDNHQSSFAGSIFSINRDGTDKTVLRIFSFTTGLKAYGPYGRLYRTPSGTIYGTTEYINAPAPYIGTVFAINPPTPDYFLSGSPDELASITVDDALDIYQNGVRIYTDGVAGAGVRPPIPIFADPGDMLRFVVRDTYGVCASLTSVYLNKTLGCGSILADAGFNLGCGRPPDDQGIVHDYTFTIPQTSPPNLSNVTVTSPVNENGTATLSGDIADPDMGDTFSLTVNWGDNSAPQVFNYPAGTTSFSETHQYLDDNPTGTASDINTVTLKLRDNGGGCDADSTSVTVNNSAPLLSGVLVSPTTIYVGSSANVSGNVTDAGTQDPHTVVINWGDGTANTTLNLAAGVSLFNADHQYLTVGSFMIGITVTDDDTGSANTSVPVTVDPLGTIIVTRTDDRDAMCDPGVDCSLREAIKLANTVAGPDQIGFLPAVFNVPQTIDLINGELEIKAALVINATPANTLTVRRSMAPGTPDFRPFTVFSSFGDDISVILNGMTISNGKAAFDGGGVYSYGFGDLILNNCVITNNQARWTGGGIRAGFRAGSRVILNNTTVHNNRIMDPQTGTSYGGGIAIDQGVLTLNDSVVSGNSITNDDGFGYGGGIAIIFGGQKTINIINSKIIGNTANTVGGTSVGFGGGIATTAGTSTLNITGSTISGNSTSQGANNASPGGGLHLNAATTTIRSSSIFNNSSFGNGGFGGGIANFGSLNISNSTISENMSSSGSGGIFHQNGNLLLNNVTITKNSGNFGGGISGGGSIKIRNSIVARNVAATNPNVAGGAFTTNGNNMIGDPGNTGVFVNGVNGDQVGTAATPLNPKLAPLGLYGGNTFSHTLLAGSTAKDNGNNCVFNLTCAADQPPVALALDQRSAARQGTVGDPVDVGSVEDAPGFVAALPNAQVNQPVNLVIVPQNGGFNFNVANGALPPGLMLNAGAVFLKDSSDRTPNNAVSISGTPTAAGVYNFTIAATDPGGDTFSIAYSIVVSDVSGTPTPTPSVMISGEITYANAIPAATRFVSNVLVSGAGSAPVSVFTGGLGTNEGQYSLSGFGAGAYVVTPSKNGGINGAITSFDAAKIALHVAGPPNPQLNPTQLTVADVSGNNSVTSFDAGMIAKFVAGPPYSAPGIGSTSVWRFTPADRNYASVTSSISDEDYAALLMGEVSGNWTNMGARPVENPGRGPERSISVIAPKMTAGAGEEVLIPVHAEGIANKGVISYEFNLKYDPSVIQPLAQPVDVVGTASRGLTVVTNSAQPGLLRVVVYGAMPVDRNGILLYLKFAAIGNPGAVSPMIWENVIFNDDNQAVIVTDGSTELF